MSITRAAGFPTAVTSGSYTAPAVSWVTVGDLAILAAGQFTNATNVPSAVSSTKVTGWTQVEAGLDATDSWTNTIWIGTITATGADTVTVTWSGGTPAALGAEIVFDELVPPSGGLTWASVTSGSLRSVIANFLYPSLTSSSATNQAYWGYSFSDNNDSAGSTSGFTYHVNASASMICFDGTLATSTAIQPNGNTIPTLVTFSSGFIASASSGATSHNLTVTATATSTASAAATKVKVLKATATPTSTGNLNMAITLHKVGASATSTGSVSATKVKLEAVTASATSTSSIKRQVARKITAAPTSTPGVARSMGRTITGVASSTSALARSIGRKLTASAVSTGAATDTKVKLETVTATATSTGSVTATKNSGGAVTITLGALALTATGTVIDEGTTTIALGALTVTATGSPIDEGTTSITLGALSVAATGTVISSGGGVVAVNLGALGVTATGTITQTPGTGSVALGALSVAATGFPIDEGAAAFPLGALSVSAVGTVLSNGQGTVTVNLGRLAISASSTTTVNGTATFTLTAFALTTTGGVPGMKTPGSVVITVSPTGFLTEGTVAVITATFTDSTGALADPTNIFLEYAIAPPASPYGTPATITFTGSSAPAVGTCFRLSTGAYQVWLDTTAQPGYWVFDLESTGTCEAESPTGTFVVQPAAY